MRQEKGKQTGRHSCLGRQLSRILIGLAAGIPVFAPAQEGSALRQSKINYYLREIERPGLTQAELPTLLDSLASLYLVSQDSTAAAGILSRKAQIFSDYSLHQEAYETYTRALQCVQKRQDLENSRLRNRILLSLAKETRRLGLFNESARQCFALLSSSPKEDIDSRLMAYSYLSLVFRTMENIPDALRYGQEADLIYRDHLPEIKSGTPPNKAAAPSRQDTEPSRKKGGGSAKHIGDEALATYLNCKAGIAYMDNQPDTAILYLEKAINHIGNYPGTEALREQRYILTNNLANVYMYLGERRLALRNYETVLSVFAGHPASYYKAEALFNIAYLHQSLNETDIAEKYYKACIATADSANAHFIKGRAMSFYASLLSSQGRYRQAYALQAQGHSLLDSVQAMQNAAKINILKNDYENRELLKDKELLEQELYILSLKNRENRILLLVLILLLAVSIYVIAFVIKKIHIEKQKKTDVLLKNEKQQENYASTIQTKQRELLQLSRMAVKSRNTLDLIAKSVDELHQTEHPAAMDKPLAELKSTLSAFRQDSPTRFFELYFNRQAQDFRQRILRQYPDLSDAEVQLSLLTALDMSAKDISLYMNKAVRTVESSIYRLRKKLEIADGIKTNAFLKQFLGDSELAEETKTGENNTQASGQDH